MYVGTQLEPRDDTDFQVWVLIPAMSPSHSEIMSLAVPT